jgi:nucleotide-binding universal stress UspA family protein
MVRKILVPLDGSAAGESVLSVVGSLCRENASEVILARVEEAGPLDPGPSFQEESLALAREYLRDQASTLAREGLQVRLEARSGPVVETLLAIAREYRASLIAMTTHGRTASATLPFGGVAERLIKESSAPILVIPSLTLEGQIRPLRASEAPYRTILVTTDGSEVSAAVIPAASDFAQLLDSEVLLLYVSPAATGRGRAGARVPVLAPGWLREFTHPFREKGVCVRILERKGDPAAVILKESLRQHVELIAMGTHGWAASARRAMGSVTEAVLKGSSVPLLVTRIARERASLGPSRAREGASPRKRHSRSRGRRARWASRRGEAR